MSISNSPAIQNHVNLALFNTLGIDATARYFFNAQTTDELKALLSDPVWSDTPKLILGGGSNVLFVNNYGGLVIQIGIKGKKIIKEDDNHIWLTIGAGEKWHETVLYCVNKGWGGIENLSLIPGTVGAAPIQNIGAYGVELQDVFESLNAIELQTGTQQLFNKEQCEFGYRDSIFKHELKGRFVVTSITLKLAKVPTLNTTYGAIQQKLNDNDITDPTVKDVSDVVVAIRNSKLPDPAKLANAGSFFKNPVIDVQKFNTLNKVYTNMPGYTVGEDKIKVPAGWLIEECGWKGKRIGEVGSYRQQALVIINHGNASGQEILDHSRKIQQSVQQKFDIELMPEVNIIQ